MTVKVNTFEGGSDGTVVTTGNSGGASGDAFSVVSTNGAVTSPAFESDHPLGSMCCRILGASSSDFVYVRWNSLGNLSDNYGRASVWFGANPATNIVLAYLTDSVPNPVGRVRISTTGVVQAVTAANTVATATIAKINLFDWTRIEWRYQVSPNQLTIRLATTPYGIHDEEIVGAMDTGNTQDQVSIGQVIPLGACDFYIDNVAAGQPNWFDTPTWTTKRSQFEKARAG